MCSQTHTVFKSKLIYHGLLINNQEASGGGHFLQFSHVHGTPRSPSLWENQQLVLLHSTEESELLGNTSGHPTYIHRHHIPAGVEDEIDHITVFCLGERARGIDQGATRTQGFNSRPAKNNRKKGKTSASKLTFC